ncbi:MAG: NAD-dependent deacylase [Planctomycetota bacterium]|nr:MAG: NAD-dependent deacylase [Planctomycetota bacterium]
MDPLEEVVHAVQKAKWGLAFTGAGISVESGIPDFRSENGLWSKYPIEEYATREAFFENPEKFWRFYIQLVQEMRDKLPNPAHFFLAKLEEKGMLQGVITQNIDMLHRKGGSKNIVELHGRADWADCPVCQKSYPLHLETLTHPPKCKECGEYLKPQVVLFGDFLPTGEWEKAYRMLQSCDLLIVIGTSALVEPAASLPLVAKGHGAALIQIDIQPNHLSKRADIFIQGKAGEIGQKLIDKMGI